MKIAYEDIENIIAKIKVNYPFNYKNFTAIDFEILIESWYDDLKDYPKELIFKCFNEAKKVNKISITTADIIEQITKIENAFGENVNTLWQNLLSILPKINNLAYKRRFTFVEENGKTQGENAEIEIRDIYENLTPELKAYCGSASGLVSLSGLDDEQLQFEKARFLKQINSIKESIKIQQNYPQLTEMVKNIGLLKEKM